MLSILGVFFGVLGGRFIGNLILKKDESWSNIFLGIIFLGWLVFLSFRLFSLML